MKCIHFFSRCLAGVLCMFLFSSLTACGRSSSGIPESAPRASSSVSPPPVQNTPASLDDPESLPPLPEHRYTVLELPEDDIWDFTLDGAQMFYAVGRSREMAQFPYEYILYRRDLGTGQAQRLCAVPGGPGITLWYGADALFWQVEGGELMCLDPASPGEGAAVSSDPALEALLSEYRNLRSTGGVGAQWAAFREPQTHALILLDLESGAFYRLPNQYYYKRVTSLPHVDSHGQVWLDLGTELLLLN